MRWRRQDRPRTAGAPTSANGASSFHLWWRLPPSAPLVEVGATLTVAIAPAVDRLYFWALQASFHDGPEPRGAGHLGLQWYGAHPGSTAVNWGGYASAGGELAGSASELPSAPGNPNTRDFDWREGRSYRLGIGLAPGAPGRWRGRITDLAGGATTVVRDLHGGGDRLVDPVVWAEVFARCDDPAVEVRWHDLTGRTAAGDTVTAEAVVPTFQARDDGGCDNTDVAATTAGVVQRTNAVRTARPGQVLRLR